MSRVAYSLLAALALITPSTRAQASEQGMLTSVLSLNLLVKLG